MTDRRIPVIDLFAGPGGLGEGFSSVQDPDGADLFRIALSIEKDPYARETLRLRAFFREFDRAPNEFYEVARAQPGDQAVAIERLFELYPEQAEASRQQVLPATLGQTRWETVYKEIDAALETSPPGPWVLIGGPPCQAYSLVGRARMRGKTESRGRARLHRLYKVYLKLLERYRPPVFVMENVKGLLSAKVDGRPIFKRILKHLEQPGPAGPRYVIEPFVLANRQPAAPSLFGDSHSPSEDHRRFLIRAEEFGVPQARHRVILLGIEEKLHSQLNSALPGLIEHDALISVADAIGDLPRLRSGLSKTADEGDDWRAVMAAIPGAGWVQWLRANGREKVADEVVETVRRMRDEVLERRPNAGARSSPRYRPDWFLDPAMPAVSNHESRSHIREDLERYLFAASFAAVLKRSPKLVDFPPQLHPEHKNIARALTEGLFGDRFRVQIPFDAQRRPLPATTITSHISKDGHYFIHYDATQCRSLTVREAARIQTFPDNYIFIGPRTEQYRQVGNAVPPLLAYQIGQVVAGIFAKRTADVVVSR